MLKFTARRSVVALMMVIGCAALVSADHSWGNYHWARTTSSFDLIVVNSTTDDWRTQYVPAAVADWSKSSKLNLVEQAGSISDKDRRQCRADAGTVRICNMTYGYNGWLGVAGISIDPNGHIVEGYTKLNDSYFNWDYYNTADWKQSVTCQELGHNMGLDHQDEEFDNTSLKSCMDYQDPPWPWANQHDFDQLEAIYGHLDSYNSYAEGDDTGGGDGGGACNAPPGKGCNKLGFGQSRADVGWGISLGRRGAHETFLRIDPDGTRHFTFVRWVEGR
jgi:hypothetical protein